MITAPTPAHGNPTREGERIRRNHGTWHGAEGRLTLDDAPAPAPALATAASTDNTPAVQARR